MCLSILKRCYIITSYGCSNYRMLPLSSPQAFYPQVDQKLVECFAHQVFHTGFVHADPHPGNSMYTSCTVCRLKWYEAKRVCCDEKKKKKKKKKKKILYSMLYDWII